MKINEFVVDEGIWDTIKSYGKSAWDAVDSSIDDAGRNLNRGIKGLKQAGGIDKVKSDIKGATRFSSDSGGFDAGLRGTKGIDANLDTPIGTVRARQNFDGSSEIGLGGGNIDKRGSFDVALNRDAQGRNKVTGKYNLRF